MQGRSSTTSKVSASFIILEEGFQQFGNDLNKLEVCTFTLVMGTLDPDGLAIRRNQRYCFLQDTKKGRFL